MAGRIALILTEDRHAAFLPAAVQAARELGAEVDVATDLAHRRPEIDAAGARAIALPRLGRAYDVISAGYAAGRLGAILKAARPDLVHCLGMRTALLGGAACAMAGIDRRLYGPLDVGRSRLSGPAMQWAARRLLTAAPLRTRATGFLFTSEEDRAAIGIAPDDRSGAILPFAGIDPELLRPTPPPPSPPVRIAIVAKPGRDRGLEIAIGAVRRIRDAGLPIELSLVAPPGGMTAQPPAGWRNEPGISWRGATSDPAALWADHHAACSPWSGDDGVPQEILEAAACGRPAVACDLPGARSFLRDGSEGFLVPPGDPAALADAFRRLAADPVLLPRMGVAARARVLHGYTHRDVADTLKRVYAAMLAGDAPG